MADPSCQFMVNVTKSRPFLLAIILLLSGFLFIQYMDPHSTTLAFGKDDTHSTLVTDTRTRTELDELVYDSISNASAFLRELAHIQKQIKTPSNSQTTEAFTSAPAHLQPKPVLTSDKRSWQTCKRQYNVSFLKVHKAGSTTVMNLFLRFAIRHHLNIVLPAKSDGFGFNYLGYGKTVLKENIVPLPNNEQYNILCNHVVYNKQAFRAILPAGTKYIGILREPRSHFISAATYYGFYNNLRKIQMEQYKDEHMNIVSAFLKNPNLFKLSTYFVYNRMSYDFGIPRDQFNNGTFVDEYIDELDQDYELIMIMEKFLESLVLLKRVLCWNTKDILFVPLNAMKRKPDFHLSEEDDVRLEFWNRADYKLYNHYLNVFNNKVQTEGPDFQGEVNSVRGIQETVKQYCLTQSQTNLTVDKTDWGDAFEVSSADCALMKENELMTMKRLIQNAWKRYNATQS